MVYGLLFSRDNNFFLKKKKRFEYYSNPYRGKTFFIDWFRNKKNSFLLNASLYKCILKYKKNK